MSTLIDFILHIDTHLIQIVNQFGDASYLILFLIIFIETGAVILPFLPGDSLLFAASALAANASYHLNIWIFAFGFLISCLLGDSINFLIGQKIGKSLSNHSWFGKLIDKQSLEKAEASLKNMVLLRSSWLDICQSFVLLLLLLQLDPVSHIGVLSATVSLDV